MNGHLSDRDLLRLLDGELESVAMRSHLHSCEICWARSEALEVAGQEFEAQYRSLAPPPQQGGLGELTARIRHAERRAWRWQAAAAVLLIGVGLRMALPSRRIEAASAPRPSLTPGATRAVSRAAICGAERGELRRVAADVADQVFRRYGIESPKPNTYEIDYLIPPDLGGSEDPRNLWPQPYARGVWNARVKDALEDRLRSLVCDGKIDLETAQRDLARDWIGAYKHYFRTDKPLLDHVAFSKDRPWGD